MFMIFGSLIAFVVIFFAVLMCLEFFAMASEFDDDDDFDGLGGNDPVIAV